MTKEIKAKEIKTNKPDRFFFEGDELYVDIEEDDKEMLGYAHLHFYFNDISIGFDADIWEGVKKDILKLADKIKSDNRGDLPDLFKNIK